MRTAKGKPAAVADVAEGHRRVQIIYNPDPTRVGLVLDLPDDEARARTQENRVRYVDPTTPLGMAEPEPETKPEPEEPARQSKPEPTPELTPEPTAEPAGEALPDADSQQPVLDDLAA